MIPQPVPGGEAAREAGLAPPQPPAGRWRHVLGLFGSYWLSKDWKFAWFAVVALLLYQFGSAYLMVLGIRWQQDFFNAIERHEAASFLPLVVTFMLILLAQVVATLINSFFMMVVGIRWRTVVTRRYVDRWMDRNRFAEMERLRLIDNPDQRVAEDIALLTGGNVAGSGLLELCLGLLGMVVGSVSMIVILLETAEPIRFSLLGHALSIPGSTVWYAMLYAFIGSVVVTRIGRPLIRAVMRQQHREADLRAALMHVRRNAAQIGFTGAAAVERKEIGRSYEQVRHNFRSVITSMLGLNFGQGIYERIGSILPLFLLLPRYFSGAISFGQVMGARDAFQQLVGQLSYIVQSYARIGPLIACLNRIKALDDVMDIDRPRGIALSAHVPNGAVLVTNQLHIHRPNGAPLLKVADWTIRAGERWVVQGPSGAGKSTLLRALVGLWPDGSGSVAFDRGGNAMMVPQRLYLPVGTLKSAICFPDPDTSHGDERILALLEDVGLGVHHEHLHAVRYWQEELSPGEQQRIALARILLHRPSLLVLDEATSALDPVNARMFHEKLLAALPEITLVSVVHDDRLARYHSYRLTLAQDCATGGPIEDHP